MNDLNNKILQHNIVLQIFPQSELTCIFHQKAFENVN